MDLSELILNYKISLEKSHSRITVKNYISDIKHFLSWFANSQTTPFIPELLTKNVISQFQTFLEASAEGESPSYSYKSAKRHLSSLRSFSSHLKSENLLTEDPFELPPPLAKPDYWRIKEFKNFLYESKSSDLTVKYYINDIQSFCKWYEESVGSVSALHLPALNTGIIDEYSRRLQESLLLSPKSVNRKLSSLRRYLQFLSVKEMVQTEPVVANVPLKPSETLSLDELTVETPVSSYSKIPPIRLAQRLTKPYFSLEDKAASVLSSKVLRSRLRKVLSEDKTLRSQPIDEMLKGLSGKNIKKEFYAPYMVSTSEFPLRKKVIYHIRHTRPEWYKKYHSYPIVHYVHFGILVMAMVGAGIFLFQTTIGNAGATGMLTRNFMQRTFVFKGRLLDKNNKPITQATDLRLGLYTSPTATGSARVWQEVQNGIKPDSNGDITIVIGNKTAIPDSLFQSNMPLYLGIAIGDEAELSPRQEIGVPYASTAGSVQGLLPITNSNKQTNVLLALDASGALTIGGQANPVFQASGGQFTLSGNTILLTTNPGSGGDVVIDPEGNGNIDVRKPLTNSEGNITANGSLDINATQSATPALIINQESGAPLLVASAGGAMRFMVDSQGTIIKGNWAGSPVSPEFGGFGADITPATPGEILYSANTTSYALLRPGTTGQCLNANGYAAPSWGTCGFLQDMGDVLTLTNNTMDIALGGTSTGSAKFVFMGMATDNPIFKVGPTLSLYSNILNADGQDLQVGGPTTKNVLLASAGGNVGVNNTKPSRNLDVNGSWGGNVDFYSDGADTDTVTRTTQALIYDLEKNTGASETSSTTTYNIVGLPNVDGTFAYIYLKIAKDTTTSNVTQTINLDINGTQVATASASGTTAPSSPTVKHYTLIRSNNAWHLLGEENDTNADAADLAEWTEFSGDAPIPGSVVSIDTTGRLISSTLPYDTRVAGVVSTNPRITMGTKTQDSVPLALSGRIPVIVTSVNGNLSAGDVISSSPISGTGMKLTKSGPTVAKALEPFTPSDSTCQTVASFDSIVWPQDNGENLNHPCFKVPVASFDALTRTQLQQYGLTQVDYLYIGKVMALSQLSWSNTDDILASINSASVASTPVSMENQDASLASIMDSLSQTNDIVTVAGGIASKIEAFSGIVAGKIKAGSVLATNIAAQNLYAATATIHDLTVGNTLTAGKIISPLVDADSLAVNNITPKDNGNININLPASNSAVVVNGTNNVPVAAIDSQGNASFSGSLSSSSVETTDATVSGTLHAQNLIADNIEGLDSKVASIASQIEASKSVQNTPLPNLSDALAQASISAQFGTFYQGLLSLGASTFGNISVMDQLSIGTTFTFTQNSINTLGTDLAVQPLKQGAIDFMAGAVRIETDGSLYVNRDAFFAKNVTVQGNLSANTISPLPNQDVSVILPSSSTHTSSFTVQNASNSAVLAVSQNGDITASGAATIEKLNLSLVGQAQASDEYTAVASSSAGTAILKANTSELTIINPLVTAHSLIYITPAQNTDNNVLYLMRQTANTSDGPIGSFTVGVSKQTPQDILFNWLIVN